MTLAHRLGFNAKTASGPLSTHSARSVWAEPVPLDARAIRTLAWFHYSM